LPGSKNHLHEKNLHDFSDPNNAFENDHLIPWQPNANYEKNPVIHALIGMGLYPLHAILNAAVESDSK
jgi:hypothetical protein